MIRFLFSALLALASGLTPLGSAQAAERIVTLGSSVTELVFEFGRGEEIVGTDITSLYPKEPTESLRTLGHFRGLSSEGILSLRPTLVLALDSVGPPETVAAVKRTGVRWVSVPSGHSMTELEKKFNTVGDVLGKEAEAQSLFRKVKKQIDEARALLSGKSPRVLFVYARGRGAMNVAGQETAADTMIAMVGAKNAFENVEGYRPMTPEAVVAANPEVILMTTRGLESVGGLQGLLKAPGVALTPAGRSRQVIALDDLKLLNFGPRVGHGVRELAEALKKEGGM